LKSENPHAALYWAIPLVAACVYLGGYGVVRWQGVLKRGMIGNAEAQNYWVSRPESCPFSPQYSASALEHVYRPLCKAEGKMWTLLLSGEEDLSMIPLPSR
jgi:hypothetical protein